MSDSSSVRIEERLTDNGVGSSRWAYNLWRRTCSPGDPTPQRQCAWLLSTYLKEGEEQKEVQEAEDDEEKVSEIDGEVEERVTQRAHENMAMTMRRTRRKLEPVHKESSTDKGNSNN